MLRRNRIKITRGRIPKMLIETIRRKNVCSPRYRCKNVCIVSCFFKNTSKIRDNPWLQTILILISSYRLNDSSVSLTDSLITTRIYNETWMLVTFIEFVTRFVWCIIVARLTASLIITRQELLKERVTNEEYELRLKLDFLNKHVLSCNLCTYIIEGVYNFSDLLTQLLVKYPLYGIQSSWHWQT